MRKVFVLGLLLAFASLTLGDITKQGFWICEDHVDPGGTTQHIEQHSALNSCQDKADANPDQVFTVSPPTFGVTSNGAGGGTPPPPPPPPDPPPPPPPGAGDGTLLFTDITYAPDDPDQAAFVRIFGLDLPADPVVRVGGKGQLVIRHVALDGTANTYPLPEHPGLTQAGLTPSHAGEFYHLIEIALVDVDAGDTGITVDGVPGQLDFVVGGTGNVYFVSPAGSNSASGDHDNPWADWTAVEGNAGPGDVIYLRGGLHTATTSFGDTVSFSNALQGAPGLPIAAVAYPAEIPVIDSGAGVRQQANHVTVAGLKRTNGGMGVHSAGSPNVSVRFVYNDISGGSNGNGFNFLDMKHVQDFRAIGNHMHDAGTGGTNRSEGAYVQGHGENFDVFLEHNYIHDFQGKGFLFVFGHSAGESLSGLFVRYNHAHTGVQSSNATGLWVGGTDGTPKNWINDFTVDGNTFFDLNNGMLLVPPCPNGRGDPSIRAPKAVATIRNNVLFGNGTDIIAGNLAVGSTADNNSLEQAIVGGNCNGGSFPVAPNLVVN